MKIDTKFNIGESVHVRTQRFHNDEFVEGEIIHLVVSRGYDRYADEYYYSIKYTVRILREGEVYDMDFWEDDLDRHRVLYEHV